MSMLRALALGGGAAAKGFTDGVRQAEADKRLQDEHQFKLEQQARTMRLQAQEDATQADVRAAAAPVAASPDMLPVPAGEAPMQRMVKPDTQDNIDVGQPGEQAPMPASQVQGVGGLNPQQAAAATAQANSPDARMQRITGALQKGGKVLEAEDVMAKAQRAKLDTMTTANAQFDDGLNQAAASGGLQGVVDYVNTSGVAPTKARIVASADGKNAEIHIVQPDGSLKPSGMVYPNNAKGAADAAQFLSHATPISAKVQHYMAEKEAERKADHEKNLLAIEGRKADTMEAYRANQAAYWEGLVGAKEGANDVKAGQQKPFVERLSEPDKMEFADINKKRELIQSERIKGVASGMLLPGSPGMKTLETEEAQLNLRAKDLVSRYESSRASQPPADPQGLRKTSAPAGAPSPTKVAPATQASRDGSNDRVRIMQDELAAEQKRLAEATTPEAKARNQSNIDAIQKEIAKLPKGAMQTATAPAAAPAPKPAPSPAPAPKPAAAPAPKPATPAPMQAATGDKVLAGIEASRLESLTPFNDAVATAKKAMSAAAKSGDAQAAIKAAHVLADATQARDKAARDKLGNQADRYLASQGS